MGFGVALLLAGASPGDQDAAWRKRGAGLLAPFKQELQAALLDGMARSPDQAIDACRTRAPEIAAAASAPGVRVGRTSHRLRNPENAPSQWLEPILARYVAEPQRGEPTVVVLPEGRVGYVEPIRMKALCLTCHGTALSESVSLRLAALYPNDEATGFELGDLRGLFWAEFPSSGEWDVEGADTR